MQNSGYWRQRFTQMEAAQNRMGAETFADIERLYQRAQREIEGQIARWYQRFADNNGISLAEARKMLSKGELKELKWDIQEYIKRGQENAVSGKWMKELENASARFHISRLEALKIQTQQSMETLFAKQDGALTAAMGKMYKSSYYRTAYEMQKGFNIGWDIAGVDQRTLEKVISKPWAADGKNFSERIWSNKERLIREVHNELTQNILLGADPQKAIDKIAKKMNTSKHNAGRLVMTEEAYFSSAAQQDCFNELDVEKYEIVATLDSHTSDICRSLDGKVFPMKDYEAGVTAPPFHVYCRSTTVPYFEDDFGQPGERAARDEETGKTYYVPADMSYKEWKEAFVDGGDKSGLAEVNEKSVAKDAGSGIMKETRAMANGLRTSPTHILSDDEITGILKDAETLKIPKGILKFNEGSQTGFSDRYAVIHVRGDILPDLKSRNLRDNLSQRAVLAHEYYGHYKAHPSQFRIGDWRDEFRASYRAAIDTPGLSDEERRMLMLDAYDRAKEAGVSARYNKTARRMIYGYDD